MKSCDRDCLSCLKLIWADKGYQIEDIYAPCEKYSLGKVGNCFPLLWAAFKGHADIVEYFIDELGADANKCLEGHNTSPLNVAAEYGHLRVCEILVKANADLNEVSIINNSAQLAILILNASSSFG